ncbi:NADPH:quinone reductase [Evansella tamaricis]|uniref:NADPH:quinone reductase n=1 Tax=Evansella tamaricis TaxID=2069301 RepID=A0ABS6JDJ9_9BACI|nr:NADPH:quinone reductase [Evansella tamaricis]MBU9711726.1 NADPH:quinone reductase [Evansella tamaricis]
MKAVVYKEYGGPDVLIVADVEKPAPGKNEVLIKVGGSAVNPVDTYFRKGIRQVPSFPHIPHFDLGGEIAEIGEDVTQVNVGDRVWGTNIGGTAAEYVLAKEDQVFPLPSHKSDVEGAAIAMPYVTAHLSLYYRANLNEGETVLIYGGAGAVGNAAIQLAKTAGAKVITTAGNSEKGEISLRAGADHVIFYKEENIVEKVKEFTNDDGVDVILDMSLSENMENDLNMIKIGGRIVTIGSPVNNSPTLPWRLLNQKNAALLGVLVFTTPKQELLNACGEISVLLKEKKITAYVGETFLFEEAARAHEAIERKRVNGNIILTP